jgi:hypothetical protein
MSENGRIGLNSMDKFEFVSILDEKMDMLKNVLIKTTDVVAKGFKINSNATINKNDVCSAYLTCFRNQQDESIDLTIDVVFRPKKVILDADIYWSNGSFIEDLGIVEIPLNDSRDTKSALEEFFDQLIKNGLKKYSDFILQQKDEPN